MAALAGASEVLIFGHAQTKQHFTRHLEERHPALAKKVVGVETVDTHLTEGELLQRARAFFERFDRLGGLPAGAQGAR